jgi:hypothetical protein
MDGDDYSVHPVVIGRGAWTWSLIWIDPLQQPIGWSAAPTETPAPCLLTARQHGGENPQVIKTTEMNRRVL